MSEVIVDDFLAHYGVRGMRWGRRSGGNSSGGSGSGGSTTDRPKMTSEEKKALVKKVAIGTGILVLAAGTAYVGYSLKAKGNAKASEAAASLKAKETATKILKEPTGIVFYGRGKNKGFRLMATGGTPTPMEEFDKGFQNDSDQPYGYFHKYEGKVAAVLKDPEGRKDHAGRVIPHNLIIPKTMASGINSIEDVADKIWPKLNKEVYDYE